MILNFLCQISNNMMKCQWTVIVIVVVIATRKILKSMVLVHPVDVVQSKHKWLASPDAFVAAE